MAYLLDIPDIPDISIAELEKRFSAYSAYLKSIESRLPVSAAAFALADWHYDFGDPRAPHDAWLDEILVSIHSSGARSGIRSCDIHARFLDAYHTGYITLLYKNVHEYSIVHVSEWQYDEIRLGTDGHIEHEIRFDANSRWIIECDNIEYLWEPLPVDVSP